MGWPLCAHAAGVAAAAFAADAEVLGVTVKEAHFPVPDPEYAAAVAVSA